MPFKRGMRMPPLSRRGYCFPSSTLKGTKLMLIRCLRLSSLSLLFSFVSFEGGKVDVDKMLEDALALEKVVVVGAPVAHEVVEHVACESRR